MTLRRHTQRCHAPVALLPTDAAPVRLALLVLLDADLAVADVPAAADNVLPTILPDGRVVGEGPQSELVDPE